MLDCWEAIKATSQLLKKTQTFQKQALRELAEGRKKGKGEGIKGLKRNYGTHKQKKYLAPEESAMSY